MAATRRLAAMPARMIAGFAILTVAAAGCRSPGRPANASVTHIHDPAHTIAANPDYTKACAPSGIDTSLTCVQVALQAINDARAKEGVGPMALPAGFNRLSVPEQLFVAVDRERVDRGLPPFAALTRDLNAVARTGADSGTEPPDPGRGYAWVNTEWIGGVANGLDADYLWMYDDGPGSGVRDCGKTGGSGCWADRHAVLDNYRPGPLVMGAAINATADTGDSDRGGPSLAAVLAAADRDPGPGGYRWATALSDTQAGTIRPRPAPPPDASATGIPDPAQTEPPVPDYSRRCATTSLDSSPGCLEQTVQAVNNARARESVRPMVLPPGFAGLGVPEQVLVAIDLERVDRGLPPFVGLTAALNTNAQRGADTATDPPDPGRGFDVSDTEWAGASVNGLDAVYGWMYDDGKGSGNLDCPAKGGPGCWGHRHGILDNFGTVGTLVMGAAVNPTGDSTEGDKGGISIAATLAIARQPGPLLFTWGAG